MRFSNYPIQLINPTPEQVAAMVALDVPGALQIVTAKQRTHALKLQPLNVLVRHDMTLLYTHALPLTYSARDKQDALRILVDVLQRFTGDQGATVADFPNWRSLSTQLSAGSVRNFTLPATVNGQAATVTGLIKRDN
jgi:hypothetical protein